MQADVISRRPVYNEDILLLPIEHSSYSSKIVSAVGNSNNAHLVIFSTAEGRRACLKKIDAVVHELELCLNSRGASAVRVKVWYFPGPFRTQAYGEDEVANGLEPLAFLPRHTWADFAVGVGASASLPLPSIRPPRHIVQGHLGLHSFRGASFTMPYSDCLPGYSEALSWSDWPKQDAAPEHQCPGAEGWHQCGSPQATPSNLALRSSEKYRHKRPDTQGRAPAALFCASLQPGAHAVAGSGSVKQAGKDAMDSSSLSGLRRCCIQ